MVEHTPVAPNTQFSRDNDHGEECAGTAHPALACVAGIVAAMALFRFEVEWVSPPRLRTIFVRRLDEGDFEISAHSGLQGCAVLGMTIPRAADQAGHPRRDLFAFEVDADDLSKFRPGDEVEFDAIPLRSPDPEP